MGQVRETKLPGVGVKHEFTASDGATIGVVEYHDGRYDVVMYDKQDPDKVASAIHLSEDDTHTLANLLGAAEITRSMGEIQQEIEGLAFRWIAVPTGSPAVGHSIAEGGYRTRTGTSVVAVQRGSESVPAPGPDFVIEAGDTVVAVGTTGGLSALRALIAPL